MLIHPTIPESALILLALLASPAPGAEETDTRDPGEKMLGQCFASPRKALQALFGEAGSKDETLVIRPVHTLKDGSLWLIDRSPGSNVAWFLLQPGKGRSVCLTLFVPAAVQVNIQQQGTTQTAEAKTQASLGPTKQATYQRPKGARVFSFDPQSCLKITYTEDGASSRQQVPCSTRFYYD